MKSQGATNRQLKVLKLFDTPFKENQLFGVGYILASIFSWEENRIRWRKYVYLTQDFDNTSPDLFPFTEKDLEAVVLPEGYSAGDAYRTARKTRAEYILYDKKERDEQLAEYSESAQEEINEGRLFDSPIPHIEFQNRSFAFTGTFHFGTRSDCFKAIKELGGIASKTVTMSCDYLVIGAKGSGQWSNSSFGRKIIAAIGYREEQGSPQIISEEEWAKQVKTQS